jgi:ribosomal protein L11 methyltransferase
VCSGLQVRLYPALDIVGGDPDRLLAVVDDFSTTAIEERDAVTRVFFASADARDMARAALAHQFAVEAVDVSDEDWAQRSQENLQPVTVGRLTIVPNLEVRTQNLELGPENPEPATRNPLPGLVIVIQPSMGFGTGHHATTRLCLAALQELAIGGKRVLDLGTGSGILAIAADRLGAASAVGIDVDPDAIESARENLALNPEAQHVRFEVVDLSAAPACPDLAEGADIVLANLTGALIVRAASTLRAAVASDGVLIVSGLQTHERDAVLAALSPAKILWQRDEDEWSALAMRQS